MDARACVCACMYACACVCPSLGIQIEPYKFPVPVTENQQLVMQTHAMILPHELWSYLGQSQYAELFERLFVGPPGNGNVEFWQCS